MKKIIIITPCFNEEENIETLYLKVKDIFKNLINYNYEHLFIDNSSTDQTLLILKKIAKIDKNVKIIVNSRNFGHITSPYYALFQLKGDAYISIVADLQDPPSLIENFLDEWEKGYKIVVGVKQNSEESFILFNIRKLYYNITNKLSTVKLIKNFTGFGLYDKDLIEMLRNYNEPYPYFRGLIMETGFDVKEIYYRQPKRYRGITKNNFYSLYDIAMLGITSHSMIPLRLSTIIGFIFGFFSFLFSLSFFVYKMLFWDKVTVGIAPLIVGVFFILSILLFFIGIIGEYLINIQRYLQNKPLVIEKERIGFDNKL